jgi:CheY-like chemotaxis protein
MDIHMPGMGGLTAFKKLQTMKEVKGIPIIALTADAMDGDTKEALDMGFKSYITKPIDVLKSLNSIGAVLA